MTAGKGPTAVGRAGRAALAMALIAAATDFVAAQAPSTPAVAGPAPQFEESIEVVGATPVHGLGIERDKIPGNVQAATAADLARTGAVSLAEQLTLAVPSVHVNDATTNPFQPDLQFRGFVASPLLGLPQGIAVYQDGVRLNEPFGDTVNWDLLPDSAVASINLMPGSNPLFGLNALGGALSVQTKTGFSHPRHEAAVTGGSFGRYRVEAASGANRGRLSYFVAGAALSEDGWRDFSPSRLRQLFGDVEWRGASTTVNATLTAGANRLVGNGAAPVQLLDESRSSIFTYPDETKTKLTLLTLRGRHNAGRSIAIDGVVFYRRAAIDTFNGDDSNYDECDDEEFEEFLCADEGEGEPVGSQFEALIPVDDDDELNGTNNTSGTVSNGWGGTLQATATAPVRGRPNHFVAGVGIDAGRSRYAADTEIARLMAERGTVGRGLFDEEAVVRLRTRVRHTALYAADFFTIVPNVTVMAAGRFTRSVVELRDQRGDDLDGDHRFSRLNPAAGATYQLPRRVTAFGSFSMSSRVPVPSELSCADPDDPCRLPNAFVADPPLEQVVASTWEGGIRGRGDGVAWNASVFSTVSRDDIMFISSGPLTNTGHFQNVGNTHRRGLELQGSGRLARVRWALGYTFLRASFETALTLSSPHHPHEADGEISVQPGDRIPGVPQHQFKTLLSAAVARLTIGGSFLVNSSQFLRGDEANLLPALDGFGVVNVAADYALDRRVTLTGRVTNLLDSRYSTFGLLGEADEVLGDEYGDPRFLGPGAPRAAWVGLAISFR